MEEKKEEVKKVEAPKEPPKDQFIYKRDHNKSLREISLESAERSRKEMEIKRKLEEKINEKKEKPVEKKEKEVKKEEPKVETKPEIDIEKIKQEAAEVARQETKKEFEAKMQSILDKEKSDLEKQKEADELISVWDKEKRLPTDYKEIVKETQRLAEVKYKQLERQREEKLKSDYDKQVAEEGRKKTEQQKAHEARVAEINKRVETDLEELKENKFLKDEERDDLLKFGIELNTKRAKENLPPVDSISKIYFMHYKPHKDAAAPKDDQPPGANAPISGARSAPPKEDNTKGYVYARDHSKSYRQILEENLRRSKS